MQEQKKTKNNAEQHASTKRKKQVGPKLGTKGGTKGGQKTKLGKNDSTDTYM